MMHESILNKLTSSWKRLFSPKKDNDSMETLTAYLKDAEHEELTVITALRAHLDLMHDEQIRNSMPVNRFDVLNRSIMRLISDIEALACISQQAIVPQKQHMFLLEDLMREIEASTQLEFEDKEVTLSWNIKKGTTLLCNANQMKHMLCEIILAILSQCKKLDIVRVTGHFEKRCVTLTFTGALQETKTEFLPWRLGELHLIPSNGDGIAMSTIDAMARLQHGRLSINGFRTENQVYKLIFNT
ncbi:MAG: hypothetical protein SFY67_05305 [Candidatus Melainabacteria bacterium]|nr:hypothetical protein [Candidatus Melainabacteria bacterium]